MAATHLVVLEDVRGKQIDPASTEALERFVHRDGGGLIFTGGGSSFGDKALHDTAIQTMLPVTLEPRRPRPGKRDPLALFLVIDRSNSMGFNSRIGTLRDGEKLRYAIKAGIAVVKQLKDHDSVGVIAFDARPHEIAPLRPLKANRDKLLAALPRIVESGGTDFYDALVSAGEQLNQSRVSRKHVVLLTDGDTNRAGRGEYRALIAKLARSGISVTTIRIGDNTVNLKLLQDISQGTGGSFHHVENAQMLPDLMLRDTSRALRKLTPRNDRFFPAVGMAHQLLTGTEEGEIPHLGDYAFSKPKPNSETLLHVARSDRKDPVLSVWRYGLGRVAAFTASPERRRRDVAGVERLHTLLVAVGILGSTQRKRLRPVGGIVPLRQGNENRHQKLPDDTDRGHDLGRARRRRRPHRARVLSRGLIDTPRTNHRSPAGALPDPDPSTKRWVGPRDRNRSGRSGPASGRDARVRSQRRQRRAVARADRAHRRQATSRRGRTSPSVRMVPRRYPIR